MRLPVTSDREGVTNQSYVDLYLGLYKEWLTEQAVTANTLRAYHSRIKQFLLFLEYSNLSDEPLADWVSTSEAIRSYLDFRTRSKASDVTINASINALNNFCCFLGIDGMARLKLERCRVSKSKRVLTVSEQARFLHCVEQQSARDKALALILFSTGLRIGHCARLNVDNIGAGAACISLGSASVVPLNEQAALAVRQWLSERQRLGTSQIDSPLWLTKQGRRLSVSGIAFVIKRIGWQARLTISVEMLRRTWLVTLADHLQRSELASRVGGYLSEATVNRYGISLPIASAITPLDQ